MDATFEQWAKSEIARLRAEADGLQRAVDKYMESQGKKAVVALTPLTNGASHPRRLKAGTGKGAKREFVLAQIGESREAGASNDELFAAVEQAKLGMKRASLRAMLYHEKKEGHIKAQGGRYFLTSEGPSA